MNDEGYSLSPEQSGEVGSESSTVETIQVEYSDQLQIIINQQQVMIGVSAFVLGALIVSAMFIVFSRFF